MPKAPIKPKHRHGEKHLLATLPWSCTHFGDQSEIEAFIPATGKWETIADVRSVGNVDAEDLADFIIHAVGTKKKKIEKTLALNSEKQYF